MKVTNVLLILVVLLAIKTASAGKSVRVPFRIVDRNTTFPLARRQFGKAVIQTRFLMEQAWIGPIEIGTPPQTFQMVYDTGSYGTWVLDAFCESCGKLPRYSGKDSRTFHDLETPFLAIYPRGLSVQGTWSYDVFTLGPQVAFPFPFGRAKIVPDFPNTLSISGIVGLRLGKSKQPYPAMLQVISDIPLLDSNVISCRFDKGKGEGELLFGAVEPQFVQGDIEYINVIAPDWVIPIDWVQTRPRAKGQGQPALIDTGNSFIMLGRNIVEGFYKDTGAKRLGNGIWVVPDPFPYDMTFWFGDGRFNVPKEDIVLRDVAKQADMYLGAVQESADRGKSYLGNPFIKNQYMVFDFAKRAVGIGKRAEPNEGMSSNSTD